jgi:hypothetical protein
MQRVSPPQPFFDASMYSKEANKTYSHLMRALVKCELNFGLDFLFVPLQQALSSLRIQLLFAERLNESERLSVSPETDSPEPQEGTAEVQEEERGAHP